LTDIFRRAPSRSMKRSTRMANKRLQATLDSVLDPHVGRHQGRLSGRLFQAHRGRTHPRPGALRQRCVGLWSSAAKGLA
jgi:hypothetical protein